MDYEAFKSDGVWQYFLREKGGQLAQSRQCHNIIKTAEASDAHEHTVADADVTKATQPTLEQQLEMALTASQCTPTRVVLQSDSSASKYDRDMLAAIKAEIAVLASSGKRGQFLQRAYDYIMTVPATSVEAERAFSAAGIICCKLRCRLGDSTVDTLSFLRAFYRDTVLPVA